jgi:hypothetical protein
MPKSIPWNVKRQMLEEEDRIKAHQMKESIDKIEKEVGLKVD